jgi:hypothetical protein
MTLLSLANTYTQINNRRQEDKKTDGRPIGSADYGRLQKAAKAKPTR